MRGCSCLSCVFIPSVFVGTFIYLWVFFNCFCDVFVSCQRWLSCLLDVCFCQRILHVWCCGVGGFNTARMSHFLSFLEVP